MLLIGLPLGDLDGAEHGVRAVITPILDVMQTMPSFDYLARWCCSSASAPRRGGRPTLIYAMPPLVRISATASARVSPATVEASDSLG